MKSTILNELQDAHQAIDQLQTAKGIQFIQGLANAMVECFKKGGKILIAGNGGSLCDAMHFAEELTGFFRNKRPALPAIALADPSHISCVGNDVGFDQIFSRSVEAYGKPGDIFIGLSTSGNSVNIIEAFKKAKELNLVTVAFLGKTGGQLKSFADLELLIEGFKYSDRVQEAHMTAIHIAIQLCEHKLFYAES